MSSVQDESPVEQAHDINAWKLYEHQVCMHISQKRQEKNRHVLWALISFTMPEIEKHHNEGHTPTHARERWQIKLHWQRVTWGGVCFF